MRFTSPPRIRPLPDSSGRRPGCRTNKSGHGSAPPERALTVCSRPLSVRLPPPPRPDPHIGKSPARTVLTTAVASPSFPTSAAAITPACPTIGPDPDRTDKDLATLSARGHFLKGSSAALGFQRVQHSCEALQHFGKRLDAHGEGPECDDDEALKRCRILMGRLVREQKDAREVSFRSLSLLVWRGSPGPDYY